MQIEVLTLSARGHTREEIAGTLFISVPTVKHHLSLGRQRVGAKNTTQAVAICVDRGWVVLVAPEPERHLAAVA